MEAFYFAYQRIRKYIISLHSSQCKSGQSINALIKLSRLKPTHFHQCQSSWCGQICQARTKAHRCELQSNLSELGSNLQGVSWSCNHHRKPGLWRSMELELPAKQLQKQPSSNFSDSHGLHP